MRTFPPRYCERRETFRADACQPLAQAGAKGTIRYSALARGQYPGEKLSAHSLPGVRSVGFWDTSIPQTWGLDWHRNEGIELTFLERGRLAFAVEGADYLLQAGDLTFARPWQPHRVGSPNIGPSRLHWVILDVGVQRPHQSWRWPPWLVITPRDRNELTIMLRQAARPVWHAGDEIAACFARIASAVGSDRHGSNVSRLTAYLNELFVLLLELLRGGEVPFDRSLSTVQRTVELFWEEMRRDNSLLGRPWSVGGMAEFCGMGITQFTRLCRQLTNITPMEYLNCRRVEAARDMLAQQPKISITQVGLACGFGSSQYFAKVFRQILGCSPTQFRRRCRQGEERANDLEVDFARGPSDGRVFPASRPFLQSSGPVDHELHDAGRGG